MDAEIVALLERVAGEVRAAFAEMEGVVEPHPLDGELAVRGVTKMVDETHLQAWYRAELAKAQDSDGIGGGVFSAALWAMNDYAAFDKVEALIGDLQKGVLKSKNYEDEAVALAEDGSFRQYSPREETWMLLQTFRLLVRWLHSLGAEIIAAC